jgi:heme/copper-type cytochrome/quinol oxidase subunit 2
MRGVVIAFGVCALACLVAHVAILLSVLRARSAGDGGELSVPRPRLGVEILWAVIPAVVLAFVLTATWTELRERAAQDRQEISRVPR